MPHHDDLHAGLPELTRAASDVFSARRVFGEAYEREGVLVIPVAKVIGSHGVGAARGDGRMGIRKPDGTPDDEADAPGSGAPTEDAVSADLPEPHADPAPLAEPAPGPWPVGRGPAAVGPGLRALAAHRPHLPRPYGRGGGDAEGAGFAARVKPLGVYVVHEDGVTWRPALDLNRVILGGQALGAISVVALSFAVAFGRRRRR
jgi:uncharacterized spore protein YtfJ